jgi:hypothetical protein
VRTTCTQRASAGAFPADSFLDEGGCVFEGAGRTGWILLDVAFTGCAFTGGVLGGCALADWLFAPAELLDEGVRAEVAGCFDDWAVFAEGFVAGGLAGCSLVAGRSLGVAVGDSASAPT